MIITEALKAELAKWLDTYWTTYMKGDFDIWSTFIAEDYYNIGGTKEEIWHTKQEILDYSHAIHDQMVGQAEFRNRQIEALPYGDYVMVNEFTDLYVKIEGEWTYYGPFRMSSLLEKTDTGWIALHQHGSYPDMKAMEGEAFASDALKAENKRLQEAVDQQTSELLVKNRELEIETSLEKVRAVAMGMKKPEDMLDVCRIISDQLQQFGVDKIRNVQLAIIDENIGQYLCYQYFTSYDKTTIEKTEYLKSPVEHGMVKQMLASRDGYFIGRLSGKELEDFRIHRKEENHFPDPFLDEATALDYCFLSIGEGGLGLTLYQPMAEDILTLFKRFHQVFSLAYQRFRDIQKAEAQAREAQIEVAVERVRAQSMAMHHPDDLDKVNKEILTQLNWLQIEGLSGVTFYLVDQDGWVKAWDFSSPGNIGDQKSYTLQFDFKKYEMMGYPFKIFQQTDLNYLVADYALEKLERAVIELEEINPGAANAFKEALAKGILTHQWSACARISDGILGIDLVSPPTEDTKTIVLKIAGAFNQAYQRFLDLQKAEAHARESEIDLALERVRAQTMAMHSSEDVGKCVVKMFSELTALGVDEGTRFGIGILNHENENNQLWTARKDGDEVNMHIGNIDMASHPLLKSARKAWKAQVPLHKYVLEGEDLLNYYQMLNNAPDYKIQIPLEKLPEREIQHCFIFEHGFFYAFSPREFQPELIHITKRFSSLFEQTYRRYLDLVRAESQAREAEIELALERVRARTMAMQHSDELTEASEVLDRQVRELGIETWGCAFHIYADDPEGDYEWFSSREGSLPFYKTPRENFFLKFYEKGKAGETFHVEEFLGEDCKVHYDYLMTIPVMGDALREIVASGASLPESQYDHIAFFKEGFLLFITYKPVPESHAIFQRLAKVFEQTYTRFLDLQKAEAQAREAEIELSLERVRARTMAMHKSDELGQISALLFKELRSQGLTKFFNCSYVEVDQKNEIQHIWTTNPDGDQLPPDKLPLKGDAILIDRFKAWKEQRPLFYQTVSGNALQKHIDFVSQYFTSEEMAVMVKNYFPHSATFYCANFSQGYLHIITESELTIKEEGIFIRFTQVFKQAYTRFLDLQKAEAQAKEAQIEAALERVRSRSLAMHKTAELQSVIHTVHHELLNLNISISGGSFIVINSEIDTELQCWGSGGTADTSDKVHIPRFEKPFYTHLLNKIISGPGFFTEEYTRDEKIEFFTFLFQHEPWSNLGAKEKKEILSAPGGYTRSCTVSRHTSIFIINHFGEKFSESENAILKRFGKVFEQSYTRFLDLQKAEAQAREARIEAALERVRSRSMAMHNSSELKEVVLVLYQQLDALGLADWGCEIMIFDEKANRIENWVAESTGSDLSCYIVEGQRHSVFERLWQHWRQQGPPLTLHHTDKVKLDFDNFWLNETGFRSLPDEVKKSVLNEREVFLSYITMRHGMIGAAGYLDLPEEKITILQRFAKVFEQTYTRFLDLQKAEAQAKEAKIEAALERVRSRSMAMHKTDELQEVVRVVAEELKNTGVILDTWGAVICTYFQDSKDVLHWTASEDPANPSIAFLLPYFKDELFDEAWESKERGDSYFDKVFSFEVKNAFFNHAFEHSDYRQLPDGYKKQILESETHGIAWAWAKNSAIMIPSIQGDLPSEDEKEILIRFARVFEQSFIRFLDLEKAEAQAREAQIEAALERVRSRSMAMHKSEDLLKVITVVSEQLQHLNFKFNTVSFAINSQKHDYTFWFAILGDPTPIYIQVPYIESPMFDRMKDVLESGLEFYADTLTPEENRRWHEHVFQHAVLPSLTEDTKAYILRSGYARSIAIKPSIMLIVSNYAGTPYSDNENEILKRFGTVFEQSYTRFLDLKKAEAQAREAQIEAALEKVRGRSMAMQKSEELPDAANLLFRQIQTLGMPAWSAGYCLWDKDKQGITAWMSSEGVMQPPFHAPLNEDPTFIHMRESYEHGESLHVEAVGGEELVTHYEYMRTLPVVGEILDSIISAGHPLPTLQVNHAAYFSHGYLLFITYQPVPEAHDIFKRFAKVFEQTYTRFLDLKKAEAQAREATKQASLDRVRGIIASMRSANDLELITPLVFRELTILGVPFIRCGVFIIQEKQEIVEAYLSSPDGNSLGLLRLPYQASELTNETVEAWRKGVVYRQHWNKEDFVHWIKLMMDQDQIQDSSTYQGAAAPPESLDLHFIPFTQGMLYVGAENPLDVKELELVQALAKAFSIAYARYEDFVKLEQAKAEVESAMSELKATQSQLVQQEKLASLGQLTAGIAHEIKNPLNFVNNFSEVSIEMIEEAKEERSKSQEARDETLVDEILEDIKSNLEKIHEHGSRANGIVTSMLQHSRGGSGKMEPTDLNALVKEYVNLSFHGMRAGKNPIDVDIQLDLDTNLGMVSLIKEDFTRVVINLCNNAFDALRHKTLQGLEVYHPKLTIRTKSENGTILIKIEDNGPGIPEEIKDKILQPFFTTKKGTEGTGLGLSITHDIVKAHGGIIALSTSLGKGTVFTIQLEKT